MDRVIEACNMVSELRLLSFGKIYYEFYLILVKKVMLNNLFSFKFNEVDLAEAS